MTDPEQTIADLRGELSVLLANGHTLQAKSMERVLETMIVACAPYLERLTEERARTRSGKSIAWLRAHHPDWMTQGLAGKAGKHRWYRRCALPIRVNLEAARAQAERDAQSAA